MVAPSRAALLLVWCAAPTLALRAGPSATSASRRAVLSGGAAAVAAATAPGLASAKDKEYMTMEEYNKIKRQGLKDENLYGLFESLRDRAGQTGEFDKLAQGDKLSEVSKLALAWDSTIRKEILDKANEQLAGKDKDAGAQISKAVLEDLKKLDKLAKAGSKEEVPGVSAALRGHVLEFVALEPQRLVDRFGIGDL
jgi:hypothetical protein